MVSVDRELASLALNDKADLLWTDEHFTRTQLVSENWHARYFSFKALLSIWIQDDDEKLNLSTTTVLNDSNDQVVIAALDAIGEILAGSFNRDFSRFLAKVVSTESKSTGVRISAFDSLLRIQSVRQPSPAEKMKAAKFNCAENFELDVAILENCVEEMKAAIDKIVHRSTDNIDWDLVNQFR